VLACVAAVTIPLGLGLLSLLVLVALFARVDLPVLLKRDLPVLPIIASMVLVHGWANPANTHWIGWFGVEGLVFGTVTSLRLVCFLTVANTFLLTTPAHEIVRWTRERNRDLGLMISMAFTVTPILSEQMAVTLQAQQARGMATGPGLGLKLRAYLQVLIPVVVKALTRAEQMSLLLLARGYERPTSAGAVAPSGVGAPLEAHGFGFAYRGADSWALSDIELEVTPGTMTAVAGGSGSGKSTLLACLAGDPPETPSGFVLGEVSAGGQPFGDSRPFVSLTLQNPGIHLFQTALEEVAFSFECRGMRHEKAQTAARVALDEAQIGALAERTLHTLSGGERQRVALAAALATAPAALLLDEPFEQLDAAGASDLLAQLRARAEAGMTLLLATRSREVADMCDTGVGLAGGTVTDVADAIRDVEIAPRIALVPGEAAVVLEGATFRYPEGGGVTGFSVEVRRRETVALLGRNGAGKSTALKLAVGLLAPLSGTIRLLGDDPSVLGPQEVSRRAAMLFQDPDDQIFNARVDEEIGWVLKVRGVPEAERAECVHAVMAELGLEDVAAVHPYELSRSSRQLVALASALVGEPSVLFLDEPTTALDGSSVALALAAVERRRAAGAAIVVVTHDPRVAEGWADRVVHVEAPPDAAV